MDSGAILQESFELMKHMLWGDVFFLHEKWLRNQAMTFGMSWLVQNCAWIYHENQIRSTGNFQNSDFNLISHLLNELWERFSLAIG